MDLPRPYNDAFLGNHKVHGTVLSRAPPVQQVMLLSTGQGNNDSMEHVHTFVRDRTAFSIDKAPEITPTTISLLKCKQRQATSSSEDASSDPTAWQIAKTCNVCRDYSAGCLSETGSKEL